ncbi:MAG: hypothetical protein IJ088_10070 [Clostridia bacterium]|nr:hypothetical protein [Clostridia bacterium]
MKWQYAIMHLDDMVATIDSEGLCQILLPDFLPYNLYFEENTDISVRIENLNNFYYWCSTRVLTLDRTFAKEILNAIRAGQGRTDRERARISLSYRCVTLTDVFWVKRTDEMISFSQISLYDHSLSDAFVDVSLLGKALTVQNMELLRPLDSAGDVSTSGSVPKAWIRRSGVFYLLKDGGQRDVEAELLASRIARCFAVKQVLYEPDTYQGTPVTRSQLFTSTQESIASMDQVDIYAANHDTTRQILVDSCDPYGYHMMNLVDYLVGNTDRHWGNWGFLIDNRTNQPLQLHPLMDFNKSFLSYGSVEGAICLTTEKPMNQKEAALWAVRTVGLNQTDEVRREWFPDDSLFDLFSQRLSIVRAAAK